MVKYIIIVRSVAVLFGLPKLLVVTYIEEVWEYKGKIKIIKITSYLLN